MKRSRMPPRAAPLTTGRRRKARKPSETLRVYGPPARRAWIRSLPCIWCGATPSENAHTVGGGLSRKADASTIVPLCGVFQNGCHRAYDEHRAPFDNAGARRAARKLAEEVERRWQAHLYGGRGPEHISTIVKRVMEEL